MEMLDTNMILRYLLNDNEQMADEAEKIIRKGSVRVTMEVIAEVVYVLKGVYSIRTRQNTVKFIRLFRRDSDDRSRDSKTCLRNLCRTKFGFC